MSLEERSLMLGIENQHARWKTTQPGSDPGVVTPSSGTYLRNRFQGPALVFSDNVAMGWMRLTRAARQWFDAYDISQSKEFERQ